MSPIAFADLSIQAEIYFCVFKPNGYIIVNAPRGERVVAEWFQLLDKLIPLPSPLPLLEPVGWCPTEGSHTRRSHPQPRCAGEGHWGLQSNGSSCLDALALLSHSLAPLSPCYLFYSLLRFQFQWRLMVAAVLCLL